MNKEFYTVGTIFGIEKQRQLEIAEEIYNKLMETGSPEDVEKHIAKKYKTLGETFVAGYSLCYHMVIHRITEENLIRKEMWNFLLGIKPDIVNPFESCFPVRLIEGIALGKDTTKATRQAIEETMKYFEKKKPEPEIV